MSSTTLQDAPTSDASSTVTRAERNRTTRSDVDYRVLHRGPLATQRRTSAIAPSASKPSDPPMAVWDTVMKALAVMEERAIKNEEALLAITNQLSVVKSNVDSLKPDLNATVRDQVTSVVREQVAAATQDQVTDIVREQVTTIVTSIVKNQVAAIVKEQVTAIVQDQLSKLPTGTSPSLSYADIARTPPGSQPSGLRTLSLESSPSALTDTLYCTIDTSRVEEQERDKVDAGRVRRGIEKEMRETEGRESWRCMAVTKDPRNETRIRVTCRNEEELGLVKEAAQKSGVAGVRILRDQLFPVKVDNVNRTAVLDENGEIRTGVLEVLGKENEVKVAKLAWLSGKNNAKAYGSMVVYVTKGSDAVQLLQGQYFHVAGESAYTRVFEQRQGPVQCYKCQQIGHKAFACEKPQRCGKCAQEGHQHRDCGNEIPKCIPCGGPHESFSRHCRVLHPARDA